MCHSTINRLLLLLYGLVAGILAAACAGKPKPPVTHPPVPQYEKGIVPREGEWGALDGDGRSDDGFLYVPTGPDNDAAWTAAVFLESRDQQMDLLMKKRVIFLHPGTEFESLGPASQGYMHVRLSQDAYSRPGGAIIVPVRLCHRLSTQPKR